MCKTMADFMQMVYIKHLNLYNRETNIGFDHNFWFTTFDIMAGLIALYIGCPVLMEKERRNIRQLFIGYAINKQQQQKENTISGGDNPMDYIYNAIFINVKML